MMILDNKEIYGYGRYLGQQQQYLPQFDLGLNLPGGGMFTHIDDNSGRTRADPYVATTPTAGSASGQNAWHPHLSESWEDNIYQTTGSQSTTVVTPQHQAINIPSTPLSPYIDSQEALTRMTIRHSPNNLTSDQITFIKDLLAATSLQETIQIRPSSSTVVLNGTKHYQCTCGHLAQRKGDMSRHHESLKHAFRRHFCTICGLGFTRKDGLKRHKKKKHKATGCVAQTS